MPNHRPEAIANEFLALRADDTWPQQMYLQKLCHIANGWNLAVSGERLIDELPQAWDNGPVFRGLWDFIKQFGYQGPNNLLLDTQADVIEAELSDQERAIVEMVWRKYGHLSAKKLSDLTHEDGSPWELAYFGRGRNRELNEDDIRDHYIDLALAGREQPA